MRTTNPIFHIVLFETYVESVTQFTSFTYTVFIGSEKLQPPSGVIEKIFWALNTLCNSFPGMRTPKPIFHIVLFETYVESVTQFYEFYVYRLYRLRKTSDVFGGT